MLFASPVRTWKLAFFLRSPRTRHSHVRYSSPEVYRMLDFLEMTSGKCFPVRRMLGSTVDYKFLESVDSAP